MTWDGLVVASAPQASHQPDLVSLDLSHNVLLDSGLVRLLSALGATASAAGGDGDGPSGRLSASPVGGAGGSSSCGVAGPGSRADTGGALRELHLKDNCIGDAGEVINDVMCRTATHSAALGHSSS